MSLCAVCSQARAYRKPQRRPLLKIPRDLRDLTLLRQWAAVVRYPTATNRGYKGQQHVQVSEVGEHLVTTSLQGLSQEECTAEPSQKPDVAVVSNAAMEHAPGSPTATCPCLALFTNV